MLPPLFVLIALVATLVVTTEARGVSVDTGAEGRRREPGSALWQVAVRIDTPMNDVAAGVALGGRRRSVELDWTGPLTRRTWLDLGARYELLDLDAAAAFGGDVDAPRTSAIASLGTLLYGSRGMTPMAPSPRVLPRDEVSPFAELLTSGESPLALLGSVAIITQRLGGRARLAQVLPIADQLTEVNPDLRGDWRLERSLACSFGGTIGRALEDEATVYRLGAGLGWHPARGFEFTLTAETGRTAGRGVEADETTLSLGATLRR